MFWRPRLRRIFAIPREETVISGSLLSIRHITRISPAMRSTAAHRVRIGANGFVTRCWKKMKGPVVSYAITPATSSSPCAASRASLDGQGANGSLRSTASWVYLASQSGLGHTNLMRPWRCRAVHLQRYLRIGPHGWSRLMDRAGYGDLKGQPWFSRAQAKRLMRYHFVMLYEHNPDPRRNRRYAPGQVDRSLRRSVHPHLQSLTGDGQ